MSTPSWLTPTPPSIAIEIAARRVTVVRVAGGAVLAHASESLPEGAVVPSLQEVNIPDIATVADAVGRALDRAGLRASRRAALVIPDTTARVSLLPLEQVPARAADLHQLVSWQVRKSTPFPLEDAQLSHFVASRSASATTIAATVAKREVVAEYESVASLLGIHAGVVDLASFSVMNAVMATGRASATDWLLVHLASEATTLAILRGSDLLFYRHRSGSDDEPLGVLVHQTAMYHEDRLGGGKFAQAWISGAGTAGDAARTVAERLDTPVEALDIAAAVDVRDRAAGDGSDALSPAVGMLLREREVA